MGTLFGLLAGIGLSAATGFKVFVPVLLMGLGQRAGYLDLPDGMAWTASTPALIALAIATLVEILGYLIPYVDHALDVIAIPLSSAAGILLSYALIGDLAPEYRWTLAIVAGGGVAGGTRATMAATRAASTTTTGGLGNPLLTLFEVLLSFLATLLSLVVPVIAVGLLVVVMFLVVRTLMRLLRRQRKPAVDPFS